MFIPIMAAIAQQSKIRVSRFMMPLSYLSILGGMTTLIGSSTNLLAAQSYYATTGGEIDFFELTPMGLILASAGILYMATAGRWLLPKRDNPNQPGNNSDRDGKHFIAQIEINRGLYMDEATHQPTPGFGDLFHNLCQFARELTSMPDAALPADSIAAE
mgnify:CR=1 FL=1